MRDMELDCKDQMTKTTIKSGYFPVFRILQEKTALNKNDLFRLVDDLWDGALHLDGAPVVITGEFLDDGTQWSDAEPIKEMVGKWCARWRDHPRKTEVLWALMPLAGINDLEVAVNFSEVFSDLAFGNDGKLGMRETLLSLKQNTDHFDLHLIVNRHNHDDLLTFHKKGNYTFETARDILIEAAKQVGVNVVDSGALGAGFTMGFHQALSQGIDYRKFERVERLPSGISIIAVAGVWGDNQNLRCLFELEDGRKVRRETYFQSGYELLELGWSGKKLVAGKKYFI